MTAVAIETAARTHPLSTSQERIWFLQALAPEAPAFHLWRDLRLEGPLDVPALGRALTALVRRHESLRTSFAVEADRPEATLHEEARAPILGIDPGPSRPAETPAARRARVEAALEAASTRPFDLARPPLLRAMLVALGPGEHILRVVFHHLVADGWSLRLAARDLGALYRAEVGAGCPTPAALAVRYADHVARERQTIASGAFDGALERARERLAGARAADLPTDRVRPRVRTTDAGTAVTAVPPETAGALELLARSSGTTRFAALLSVLTLLVSRLSGETDVCVGAAASVRPLPGTEGITGTFANLVPIRMDITGDPTFRDLLLRAERARAEALRDRDVPLELLLRALRIPRDPGRTPLFQVCLNQLRFPVAPPDFGLVRASLGEQVQRVSHFDVEAYVDDHPEGGLHIRLAYARDLFDGPRAEEMLRQLAQLATACAREPDLPVSRHSLVTDAASRVLPDPRAPLSSAWRGAVHELFARRAAESPLRPAVVEGGRAVSYGALASQVERLAARIRAAGVERGEVVLVYAHRSGALVLALLGILRAGAAFAILDPSYPAPRLVEQARVARPRGLLAIEAAGPLSAALDAAIEVHAPRIRVTLPGLSSSVEDERGLRVGPAAPVGPDDLAYVAFTSGTTGAPRGVLGRHGSLTHFIPWLEKEFGLGAEDRYTLLSGLSHDPLHRDVMTPLVTGGAVVVPEPRDLAGPAALRAWVRRERATVAHLTPSLARLLCSSAGADEPPLALRRVFLVGEALTRTLAADIRALAPAAAPVNFYGATETQRAVSFHQIEPEEPGSADDRSPEVVPLGRGIEDVQLLVLTPSSALAGVGEPGEVCVRSPHVALGYAGDPTATRERFIANPFTGDPRDIVYRTGDLGRYRPDGAVEHAGRADRQVKVRGYRVEPAEVEAALARIDGVRESVVALRERAGERVLCAWVVSGTIPSVEEMRARLRERLPEYMVPASIARIDAVPRTPNGKVDLAALPDPSAPAASPASPTTAAAKPRSSALHDVLRGVWEGVLGRGPAGDGESFFDAGGGSLLVFELLARIDRATGRRVPLAALLEAPTVDGIAASLARDFGPRRDAPEVLRLNEGGARPPFVWMGGGAYCLELARHLGADQPLWTIPSRPLAARRRPAEVSSLASECIAALRREAPRGPYRLGGFCTSGAVAYEMARRLRRAGESVPLVAVFDAPPRSPRAAARFLYDLARPLLEALAPRSRRRIFRGLHALAGLAGGDPLGRVRRAIEASRERGARSLGLPTPPSPVQSGMSEEELHALRFAYCGFRASSYAGRLLVLATEGTPLGPLAVAWRRRARDVAVRRVEGKHASIIAEDVPALARALRRGLDEALAGS